MKQNMVEKEKKPKTVPDKIRIGTRGSRLALIQTDLFIQEVKKNYPQIICEKVIIKTKGDEILHQPLVEFGGKGVFVTEFEELLQSGEIDYAVHSAKDMPMELLEGLDIVCVLPRADVRDVLVTRNPVCKEDKMVIGTGSLRRQVQIKKLYPKAEFRGLRGNVGTRIEKLKNGEYDGIVLAAAGLQRAGLDNDTELVYTYFEPEDVIPAGGQAVIAVEGRSGGEQDFLQCINDKKAAQELQIERYVMQKLEAGCHEAVGVYARIFSTQKPEGMETPSCLMTRSVVLPEKRVHLSVVRERAGHYGRKDGKAVIREWKSLAEDLIREILAGTGE